VKGLDTPILLAILRDAPPARALLRELRGEELATTEINLYELHALAAAAPSGSRPAKVAALQRLRRRMTVLPITASAVDEAARFASAAKAHRPYEPLIWGALKVAGCGTWITTRRHLPPKGLRSFKARVVNI
jgi:predicted nucleic acid-binding protein